MNNNNNIEKQEHSLVKCICSLHWLELVNFYILQTRISTVNLVDPPPPPPHSCGIFIKLVLFIFHVVVIKIPKFFCWFLLHR